MKRGGLIFCALFAFAVRSETLSLAPAGFDGESDVSAVLSLPPTVSPRAPFRVEIAYPESAGVVRVIVGAGRDTNGNGHLDAHETVLTVDTGEETPFPETFFESRDVSAESADGTRRLTVRFHRTFALPLPDWDTCRITALGEAASPAHPITVTIDFYPQPTAIILY